MSLLWSSVYIHSAGQEAETNSHPFVTAHRPNFHFERNIAVATTIVHHQPPLIHPSSAISSCHPGVISPRPSVVSHACPSDTHASPWGRGG
eukprot:11802662-Karenia_brevis.AAC.1